MSRIRGFASTSKVIESNQFIIQLAQEPIVIITILTILAIQIAIDSRQQ
jgi:hypothetical protein